MCEDSVFKSTILAFYFCMKEKEKERRLGDFSPERLKSLAKIAGD